MKLIAFLSMMLFSLNAFSLEFLNLGVEPEVREELRIWDNDFMASESFSDTQTGSARITLYENFSDMNSDFTKGVVDESKRSLYFASIIAKYKWPTVLFMAEESCEEGFHANTVINVNSQNIKVIATCSPVSSDELMMGYFAETEAGNNYVINQFKDSKVVYVRFSRGPKIIPFDATGFRKAWDEHGGKAL